MTSHVFTAEYTAYYNGHYPRIKCFGTESEPSPLKTGVYGRSQIVTFGTFHYSFLQNACRYAFFA